MSEPKNESIFTAGQVGALVESLEKKISTVLEIVSPIPDSLEKIEERLDGIETRLKGVEDAVRVAIPDHEKRLSILEAKVR